MTVAVTVAVGLGAALLGAIAGFLGAVYIETSRLRRAQLGMLRALLSEIRENTAAVVLALHSGGPVELSSETWQRAKVELAGLLDIKLYENILVLYIGLPKMKALAARGATTADAKASQRWLSLSVEVAKALNLRLPEKLRLPIGEQEPLEPK